MSKTVTVLIDLDDTMTHLTRAWCKRLNERHGTNVQEEDITGWRISNYFPSLTSDEVYAPLKDDLFWREVEPITDASRYIKALIDEKFDVYVCTASSFGTIKSKFDCILSRYFPFISWEKIIVLKKKQMIKADILVDDGVHNLEGGSYKKILMSAPHNEYYDAESNEMIRVRSWEEIYKAVHSYAIEILREDDNNESN